MHSKKGPLSKRVFILCSLLILLAGEGNAQPGIAWLRSYRNSFGDRANDVYICTDGDYAVCGSVAPINSPGHLWLSLTDKNDGHEIFASVIGDANHHGVLNSLVQLDDGGFLSGGNDLDHNGGDFAVIRLTNRGELVWFRNYGGQRRDYCAAVIELKDENFLLAGSSNSWDGVQYTDGYLVKINGNGDLIWERHYGNQREMDGFSAIREVEGGYLLAGEKNDDGWLLKVDPDGEPIWSHQFNRDLNQQRYADAFNTLISIPGGGFLCCGNTRAMRADGIHTPWAVRVDADGNQMWSQTFDDLGNGGAAFFYSETRALDGGFILCGYTDQRDGMIVKIDQDGNLLWTRFMHVEQEVYMTDVNSVLVDADGGVIAVGEGSYPHANGGAIILKLSTEHSAPIIVAHGPKTFDFSVLIGDSACFRVRAMDVQNDSIRYCWRLNGNEAGQDTLLALTFHDLGDQVVSCRVSDEQPGDSIAWHVSVRDLFILSHSPDSLNLTLRHGQEVPFGVSVAATPGDPINYQWSLTNLTNQQAEVVGQDSALAYQFLRGGAYQLEAFAQRGEASDHVIWDTAVRSTILTFSPESLALTVPLDTTIDFSVEPFDADTGQIRYEWRLGEDSVASTLSTSVHFVHLGENRVTAVVAEGNEADTVVWRIDVVQPNATPPYPPLQAGGEIPKAFSLSLSPNPFNASTTIRYGLDKSATTRLAVYDLSGREVSELASGRVSGGMHSVTFKAEGLPSGVYLVVLDAGGKRIVRKALLMR